jgi:hypothetical protein
MEGLYTVNGVPSETLDSARGQHGGSQSLPPRLVTVVGYVVSVRCLNEAWNGSTVSGLPCADQGSQAILVRVVNIDVVSGTDKTQGVENTSQVVGQRKIPEKP